MGSAPSRATFTAIEDLLSGLRGRNDLTGNEFVPAVVKLGELMDYRTQIIELQSRISQFQSRAGSAGQGR